MIKKISNTVVNYIIDKIIITMDHLKITQEELAKRIGTNRVVLNRWLNRKRMPQLDFVVKMYVALEMEVPDIMFGKNGLNEILSIQTMHEIEQERITNNNETI